MTLSACTYAAESGSTNIAADDRQSPELRLCLIRRILEQAPERFDKELEAIKKGVTDDGEIVQGAWVHDMTGFPDVTAQGRSLDEWSRSITAEVRKKSN